MSELLQMYDDGSNVSADRILVLFNLTFSCPVILSKLFSPRFSWVFLEEWNRPKEDATLDWRCSVRTVGLPIPAAEKLWGGQYL